SRLRVFLGDGQGHFSEGTLVPGIDTFPVLAVGDLNGDGASDLIAAPRTGDAFSTRPGLHVFLGRPGGTFAAPVAYALTQSTSVLGVTVTDVNRDGKPDVVAVLLSGNANVLLGTGTGGLGSPSSVPLLTTDQVGLGSTYDVGSATVGDFNSDGHVDLVTTALMP